MSAQGSHFFANWAKERIDEMDAALTSLESKIGEVNADLRIKANQTLVDLRNKRDGFRAAVEKQVDANEAAWTGAKTQLEADWARFDTEVQKYVESFGEQIKQQQATFKLQADAQLKAWSEAANKFQAAAAGFATERRSELDAMVNRMKADAALAEEKLKKLQQAGTESWPVLMTALTETRAVFDRANEAVREAFKRAA
ncbi:MULTISPECIES: hypothetical protein [Bradyrhizobium]|uniref:Uncharacterized protein n=1 Tax=Bradyrhizobium elkanii TaxID=29448 RepID=A0A4U6S8Z6_BRAEL|nr:MULTISPECIES: hypothetical protein [Bradyrhizobium]MTV14293.1 hypothetical protein [Bradyrhizobium sp. BR2003]TKV83811.1 hypothetical protein FDV58_00990 [Bradyrhizobium elkanii]